MTRCELSHLLALLEDDRECLDTLVELEILPAHQTSFAPEEVELALVARTLVRELDVNWPGVEVVLRLRGELLDMRRQVAELLELLRQRSQSQG